MLLQSRLRSVESEQIRRLLKSRAALVKVEVVIKEPGTRNNCGKKTPQSLYFLRRNNHRRYKLLP
jgi:hypothetical protein